jgi:hypothetical protein
MFAAVHESGNVKIFRCRPIAVDAGWLRLREPPKPPVVVPRTVVVSSRTPAPARAFTADGAFFDP